MPVLVKIAPDLSDDDVDAVADLALELGLAGIVATNTTIAPRRADDARRRGRRDRRRRAVRCTGRRPLARGAAPAYARVGDRLALVSVGGIETADQAWERILAGATLVQGYTGFIYGGPFWMRQIHKGWRSACATAATRRCPRRSAPKTGADRL